jgi:peptidoglycan/xylan/chitin deacetylase (PgdA/CDA1 family)
LFGKPQYRVPSANRGASPPAALATTAPTTTARATKALAALASAALALAVLGTAGCAASYAQIAARSTHSSSSPHPASTSQPAGATPVPGRTTPPPPPPPPPPAPVIPANLPVATGTGPAGSAKTTGNASVALTFDDGPDPTYTPQILDLLKANGVKATFCLVGRQVKANPGLVRRIVAEGHTLCDHTWAHSLTLGTQSKEVILKDLQDTNNAIREAAPNAKIRYFRAPGGNFTPLLVGVATELGMKSIYWAVDTRDWEYSKWGHGQSMVDHIIQTVESKIRRGSIVLSHDYKKPDTITAYKTLLPWLKAHVTLIAMPVA